MSIYGVFNEYLSQSPKPPIEIISTVQPQTKTRSLIEPSDSLTEPPASLIECGWSHSDDPSKYKMNSKDKWHRDRLTGIRQLQQKTDLNFILIEGTLLGAYREGGFIYLDYDLDFVVPVWLNLDVLNYSNVTYDNCPVAKQMLLQDMNQRENININSTVLDEYITNLKYDHTDRFCGLSQSKWKLIVWEYLNDTLFTNESDIVDNGGYLIQWYPTYLENVTNAETAIKQGYRIDLNVRMNYEDHFLTRESALCLCKFNDFMMLCYDDAKEQLKKEYGDSFMTPDRSKDNGTRFKSSYS